MEKVLQKSREDSLAVGKNYGNRPISYKGALSLKLDRYTVRKESPSRDKRRRRSRSRSPKKAAAPAESSSSSMIKSSMTQEQINKLKKLKEVYGDASAN